MLTTIGTPGTVKSKNPTTSQMLITAATPGTITSNNPTTTQTPTTTTAAPSLRPVTFGTMDAIMVLSLLALGHV